MATPKAKDDLLDDVQRAFDAWLDAARSGDDRRHYLRSALESALNSYLLEDREPSPSEIAENRTL